MPLAVALTLALAVIELSTSPLLLLDGNCRIVAASLSFATAFGLPAASIVGQNLYDLGGGEWNVPRLRSLLDATMSGGARVPAYEIDLMLPRVGGRRRLVLNANLLIYDEGNAAAGSAKRLLLAVADVTEARRSEQTKDDLLREKAVLLQEVQHRVANSLQIIASILMLSARKIGSDETRHHLRAAHSRVLAVAELQRQLAEPDVVDVEIGAYLGQLCQSLGASMIDDHERISLTATADGSRVAAEVSVSIGLIVTELVINSMKHAFPGNRRGGILVDYRSDSGDWTLKVSDDGIGMPARDATTAGLGSSIVSALATHLHADIATSDGAPGTVVTLTHTRAEDGRYSAESEDMAL